MPRNIAIGIDIGTYQTKVMAVEGTREGARDLPKILGVGYTESRGLRHGYIINQNDCVKSARQAVAQAAAAARVKISRAVVSMGGIGLGSVTAAGSIVSSRADSEITELDVKKAIEASEHAIPPAHIVNRRILHTIPLQYKIDGKATFGKPEGLIGAKLEVKTLFITSLEHHANDLLETLQEAGVEVEDMVASPIAASLVTLTKAQKMAGCVLANIGSETVSIVVFENNHPISLEVFPYGSNDITNDIALGLRIPLEEAEEIKRGSIIGANYSRRKLEEIVHARLSDIFELIETHLKKLGKSGLLPAGIVLTGGGSGLEAVEDLAKSALRLPSRRAHASFGDNIKGHIREASWSVAYGLCVVGLTSGEEDALPGLRLFKKTKNSIIGWLRQFLP